MKFALLSPDAESQALADAAVAATHEQVAISDWEELLDDGAPDAAIVGRGGNVESRVRQVQELTKLGRPLLVVHPFAPSVISYFEIDMARTEIGAVLCHFNPLVESTILAPMAQWIRQGHPQLGTVEQLAATRRLPDRTSENVLWHFSRDVEALTRIAGRLDRIGAHAAGQVDAAYSSLSVQLLGKLPVPVRWAVEPAAAGGSRLQVALICQRGRATLEFNAEGRAVELNEHPGGSETQTHVDDSSPASRAVQRFAAAVAVSDGRASTWPDALDAMELADSIEISLRRGRMIDVHHRELTEQLAFKGDMSAFGCGVLTVLIPLMVAVGWIAGLVGIPLSHYWPHVLLALLAVFLVLQLAPRFLAPRMNSKQADDAGGGESKPDHPSVADSAD